MQSNINESKTSKNLKLSQGALILTTVIWGSAYITSKILADVMPPFFFMFIRFSLSLVPLLIFLPRILKIKFSDVKICFIAGLLFWLTNTGQIYGLGLTSVANVGFISGLKVILVPILLIIFWKKKSSKKIWIAACFALIGTIFLTSSSSSTSSSSQSLLNLNIGDIITFGATLSYTLYIILIDKKSKNIDPMAFAFMQMVFAALFSLVASLILEDFGFMISGGFIDVMNVSNILLLAHVSFMVSSVALILQIWGQKYVPSSNATTIFAFEPVFATIFGIIFGNEMITINLIIGAILIFVGILIASKDLEK